MRVIPSQTPLTLMMSDDQGEHHPPWSSWSSFLSSMACPLCVPSGSTSPAPHTHSPPFQWYPRPVGPSQPSAVPSQWSPRAYSHKASHVLLILRNGGITGLVIITGRTGSVVESILVVLHIHPLVHHRRSLHIRDAPHSSHPSPQHWDNKPRSSASNYHNLPPHHDQPPPLGHNDRRVDRGLISRRCIGRTSEIWISKIWLTLWLSEQRR